MKYGIEMSTDGTCDWSITLPVECTEYDLEALVPVVDSIRGFLAPTIDPRLPQFVEPALV